MSAAFQQTYFRVNQKKKRKKSYIFYTIVLTFTYVQNANTFLTL